MISTSSKEGPHVMQQGVDPGARQPPALTAVRVWGLWPSRRGLLRQGGLGDPRAATACTSLRRACIVTGATRQ